MKPSLRSLLRLILLSALCVTAVACSKVSKENYDQLKVGMDYDEVVSIVGSPDSCSEALGAKNCRWGTETRYIKVTFIADKTTMLGHYGLQ